MNKISILHVHNVLNTTANSDNVIACCAWSVIQISNANELNSNSGKVTYANANVIQTYNYDNE